MNNLQTVLAGPNSVMNQIKWNFSMSTFYSSRIRLFSFLFSLLLISCFVIFKIAKYDLCYYSTDVFSFLEMSKSWLKGNPILWESRYGNTSAIHNNYIILLFAPFTLLWNAKGLFIAHGLILLIAILFILLIDDLFLNSNFMVCFSILCILLLGPYSFWIFDTPNFGWFTDLLFLPFCVMYATAIKTDKKYLIIFCGLLLVFTKEDGPVIGCIISLYAHMVNNSQLPLKKYFRKIIEKVLIWFIVFVVSLSCIYIAGGSNLHKLDSAINSFCLAADHIKISYFKWALIEYAILLAPLCILFLTFFHSKYLKYLIIGQIPLIIVGLISGMPYLPTHTYSLSWTPRFCEFLGVFAAGAIICMDKEKIRAEAFRFFENKIRLLFISCIFIFFQFMALTFAKGYNVSDQILAIKNSDLPAGITKQKINLIHCIKSNTPENSIVVPPEYFYNVFDNYRYAWFDHLQNSPGTPDLIILDDTLLFKNTAIDYAEYTINKSNGFFILVRKNRGLDYSPCYVVDFNEKPN